MHVLITNLSLRGHTGTETAVRDISGALSRRGHTISVFAKRHGRIARDLRGSGVSVVSDLNRLDAVPDVIHGHHNIPAVAAMAMFPSTPAIWFSRDTRNWFDAPPLLRRIHRYVAVDSLREAYLTAEHGIEPGRVSVMPNAIDLSRLPPRRDNLPDKPLSVVAFTKTRGELDLIRKACAKAGLRFSAYGRGTGQRIDMPGSVLGRADIVFATGRSAIEAMCCGAAVIVADARGFAGPVTPRTYAHFRAMNFGRGAFTQEITAENVEKAISDYSAGGATQVSGMIRRDADMDVRAHDLEMLYGRAIEAGARTGRWSRADIASLERFLVAWPATRIGNRLRWRRERACIAAFVAAQGGTPYAS